MAAIRMCSAIAVFQLLLIFVYSYKNDDITSKQDPEALKCCEAVNNKDDEVYYLLAQVSMKKYLDDQGFGQLQQVEEITAVCKQNVIGGLIRINFNTAPTNCTADDIKNSHEICLVSDTSHNLSCNLMAGVLWWLNNPEMEISCKNQSRSKNILGGQTEQNPSSPQYRDMADESFMKYMKDNDLIHHHEILQVNKVTTQVVAGVITRIDFNVKLDFTNVISCHSEIWERPWLDQKEINITCVERNNKQKREIPGGLAEQNVNDPVYRDMAEESLMKYIKDNGLNQQHEILHVKKVTTQVVAGIITRIDFNAKLDLTNVISCHSEVWDRPWLNKKEINITCVEQSNKQRRQIPEGLWEKNIKDTLYRDMAEEP